MVELVSLLAPLSLVAPGRRDWRRVRDRVDLSRSTFPPPNHGHAECRARPATSKTV
jgi:hypothetical protein